MTRCAFCGRDVDLVVAAPHVHVCPHCRRITTPIRATDTGAPVRPPPARTLVEIAQRIAAHLTRFEADKGPRGVNWWHDGKVNGTRPFFMTGAAKSGRYVGVSYVSYQGPTYLTKAEAARYLAALDAGFVGRHYEALKRKEEE